MDHSTLILLRELLPIGTLLLAIYFFVPGVLKQWKLWKKTGKEVHFANAIGFAILALFLVSASFVIFMKIIWSF